MITHFGTPLWKAIVRYVNCRMRILKQRIFSFPSAMLLGEYASRIPEWGRQAVPADWIAEQLDFMLSWEKEKRYQGCSDQSDSLELRSLCRWSAPVRHADFPRECLLIGEDRK